MTSDESRDREDYLWDPASKPAPEVQDVERRLAAMRFDAAQRPLRLPVPAPVERRPFLRPLLALAAMLALVAIGASSLWVWRWSWPAGAAWPVTIERQSSPGIAETSQLPQDRPLLLDGTATARIRIARIGTMRVAPGSTLTVVETTSQRHRVVLDRGSVNVRVWAPPGRFALKTPAGNVIDLGCVFDLTVDAAGASVVRVHTGWVQMENGWGESLVPAGTSSVMAAATRPGVPVYDDAAPAFGSNVRAIERAAAGGAPNGAIDTVLQTARPRDVLTLLTLARLREGSERRALLERAEVLFPPPPTVSVNAIVGGDIDQLWRWYGTLDLPAAKSWWLNWRDALPRIH
jgi:ferric-dicitrate binding protein FerR (iron transport regulator)